MNEGSSQWLMKIVIPILLITLAACTQNIVFGEFLGLEIGMTKKEVLQQLDNNENITSIRPVLAESIGIKLPEENKEQYLEKMFNNVQGVGISGYQPIFSMKIIFTKGEVSDIHLAFVNEGEDLGIKIGDDKNKVEKIINANLESGRINIVFNFLPNSASIRINSMGEPEKELLFSYDNWGFTGASEYSFTKLRFVNDRLKKIENLWSPIEMP